MVYGVNIISLTISLNIETILGIENDDNIINNIRKYKQYIIIPFWITLKQQYILCQNLILFKYSHCL